MDTTPNVVIELRTNKVILHIHSDTCNQVESYDSANITQEHIQEVVDQYLTLGFQVSVVENKPHYSM